MESRASKIASVVGAPSAEVQDVLARLAMAWRASGLKVVGALAEPHGLSERSCGAGFLRDIASGTPYPIYLETAPRDTSCHVDVVGVERASAAILNQIVTADLVVLSKFGKLETMGRGLAVVFDTAIAAGKPILTSVAGKHRDAWRSFAPSATSLTLDEAAIEAWLMHSLA